MCRETRANMCRENVWPHSEKRAPGRFDVRQVNAYTLAVTLLLRRQMRQPGRLFDNAVGVDAVSALQRWTVVGLQALTLPLLYAIVAAPFAYAVLMIMAALDGRITVDDAIRVSVIVGFAAWPALVLLGILVKWAVIGRYQPGSYPLWSFYYFRWFQSPV